MKALVYHGRMDLRYEDFPEPPLARGEARIQVRAAGLCHTDYNEYLNGPLYAATTPHPRTGRSIPIVLGHEFSGNVIEVGPEVTRVHPGDRVAINAVDACRQCEACRRGLFIQCSTSAVIGFARDGGYAEYAVVPEDCCYILRPDVSFRAAALVEPLAVALHSVRQAGVEIGSQVAVVGGGTIGLCTLQALSACGVADVYVIEKSWKKQRFAHELGATEFICSERSDPRQVIFNNTGGWGVDFAFECVGSAPALDTALSVTRPGGTVCLTGVIPRPIQFDWNSVFNKEKTITTSIAYTNEFPLVIAMLNDSRLQTEPLITTSIPLAAALENLKCFEELGAANVKMLIDMCA